MGVRVKVCCAAGWAGRTITTVLITTTALLAHACAAPVAASTVSTRAGVGSTRSRHRRSECA